MDLVRDEGMICQCAISSHFLLLKELKLLLLIDNVFRYPHFFKATNATDAVDLGVAKHSYV